MDVGSTLCRPQSPRCSDCPVVAFCRFAASGSRKPAASKRNRAAAAPRPFRPTNRWLRGRILARLREVDGDGWVVFDDSLGDHSAIAVQAVLRTMGSEGLLELDARGRPGCLGTRARLPLA